MAAARIQLVVFYRYNSDAATGYVYDISKKEWHSVERIPPPRPLMSQNCYR